MRIKEMKKKAKREKEYKSILIARTESVSR